ncbi:hypothetical protein CY34DRAFT_813001 [Suillus luteus UH-Slu-Lm8-n1]|uniref:Uncharacterized protein n=1 Tax=Suillus luteus UH-Slu-Lm8-n1 TaxID=930992 RepID=A0A0C9ZXW9_9AGAM|nr:hypothetical protein CY34DRAFT_813001 [Suillus luteus UH-Slu-Lm8-n1]
MEYVAWYSKNDGKFGLFPLFQRLDTIAADLVAGLLNPLTYHIAVRVPACYQSPVWRRRTLLCHRRHVRIPQRHTLAVGLIRLFAVKIAQTSHKETRTSRTVKIWRALRPGRPMHISYMDWKKPRP